MEQATRLVLVRHGETAWNRATRIQGHTDIPLSELGLAQAQRLAGALADEPFSAIYASDLSRARQTAEALARPQGLQ
ncbi:histidine phosphatase family protein, partial [Pelomonas sp. HMWF004]